MRVLFLSPRRAWPATSGARLRDYQFARALAERFELTYLFFGTPEDAEAFGPHLGARAVIAVPEPKKYTPGKIIRGLAGRFPLPVLNYTSREMSQVIERNLASEPFNVVHLESLHMAAYLPEIRRVAPAAVTVLDWHNIESELMQRFAENTLSTPRSVYARVTAGQLRKLESELLTGCFGHLVCSDRERNKLALIRPNARLVVAENGVDTERFRPEAEAASVRDRLVFVGQMSYHANMDAAQWFVREVWPVVRGRYPNLKLSLVGSDPPALVRALAKPGEIEVTGTVPDVLPYYQDAFASIVPLQTGGGTRLKILEAMAAGTPVISTAAGAEGLAVSHGVQIQIAGAAAESWVAALEAITEPSSRHDMVNAARHLVCSVYDWKGIGLRLADTYDQWVADYRSAPAT